MVCHCAVVQKQQADESSGLFDADCVATVQLAGTSQILFHLWKLSAGI